MPSDKELEHIAQLAGEAAAKVMSDATLAAASVANTAREAAAALAATTSADLSYIKSDIAEIKMKLDNKYVTKDDFASVKNMVYDHETRLRTSEKGLTQIMTYGTGAIIIIGIAQFFISKFL